jgi:hypothetical protein
VYLVRIRKLNTFTHRDYYRPGYNSYKSFLPQTQYRTHYPRPVVEKGKVVGNMASTEQVQ